MNASFVWSLAGWTMIHFAWIGCLVLAASLVLNWIVSQQAAALRYATSLFSLMLLAITPVALVVWLTNTMPQPIPVASNPTAESATESAVLSGRSPLLLLSR